MMRRQSNRLHSGSRWMHSHGILWLLEHWLLKHWLLKHCHPKHCLVTHGIVVYCMLMNGGSTWAETITQRQTSGPVSIEVSLDPDKPVIGDSVKLVIQVVAEKDVEVLMPDFGDALERFAIVDFAPRQSVDAEGRTVATQTYRLDPPSSGKQVIPPILIEYVDRREGQRSAPDGLDAYEVLTERIVFEVASMLPESASAELKPPLGELAPIAAPASPKWPWLVAVGILLAVCLPFLLRAIRAARRRQRRRSAYEVASARLEKLLRTPRQSTTQIEEFYVGLSYVIRQYIEDRFEMRAPELTTEEFLASIGHSPDFSSEHQGLLREFLRQADLVKFARVEPSSDQIEHSIDSAKQFLEETRENAPLMNAEEENSLSSSAQAMTSEEEAIHG